MVPQLQSNHCANSVDIVSEVAKREGIPQSQLQSTLFETVDPDALDRLLKDGPTSDPTEIRFSYVGYEITVRSDGTLEIE